MDGFKFQAKAICTSKFKVGRHLAMVWQYTGQEVTFSIAPQITAENWRRELGNIEAIRTHEANSFGEIVGANSTIWEIARSHD